MWYSLGNLKNKINMSGNLLPVFNFFKMNNYNPLFMRGFKSLNQAVPSVTFTGTTDAAGVLEFPAVPSGRYTYHASASGFEEKSDSLDVEPEIAKSIELMMPERFIDVTWQVTPTTIVDKYDVVLEITYKTDVPAPVLLCDPPYFDFVMDPGTVKYGQYTIYNKGLIKVEDLTLAPVIQDGMRVDFLTDGVPLTIEAHQSVMVPFKVTLDTHYSPELVKPCDTFNAELSGSGKYWCPSQNWLRIHANANIRVTASGVCQTPPSPVYTYTNDNTLRIEYPSVTSANVLDQQKWDFPPPILIQTNPVMTSGK